MNPERTPVELAHFDIAGTIIDDEVGDEYKGGRLPIMIDGFITGLARVGVQATFEDVNRHRGAEKIVVMRTLIRELTTITDEDQIHTMADEAHDHFANRGVELAHRVELKKGINDLFDRLKQNDVFVTVATGFPDSILNALAEKLGWRESPLVDLAMNARMAGKGRPSPHMINFALREAGLIEVDDEDLGIVQPDFNYRKVLKVGDTVKDMDEGLKVDALTVATLEGTQSHAKIVSKGQPHFIVHKTREIIHLINNGQIPLRSH